MEDGSGYFRCLLSHDDNYALLLISIQEMTVLHCRMLSRLNHGLVSIELENDVLARKSGILLYGISLQDNMQAILSVGDALLVSDCSLHLVRLFELVP